jgi:predicted nucleic acid-binding protein
MSSPPAPPGSALYVDSSAIVKLYVAEPERATCERLLEAHSDWVTARHSEVEVRRNLARLLQGRPLREARGDFAADWARMHVVELDRATCAVAAELAEVAGARTLDALHLAAAQRTGGGSLPLLTYDIRQAQVARSLGWTVLGG